MDKLEDVWNEKSDELKLKINDLISSFYEDNDGYPESFIFSMCMKALSFNVLTSIYHKSLSNDANPYELICKFQRGLYTDMEIILNEEEENNE